MYEEYGAKPVRMTRGLFTHMKREDGAFMLMSKKGNVFLTIGGDIYMMSLTIYRMTWLIDPKE